MLSDEIRKKHQEYLFPAGSHFYEKAVVLTEGKGNRLCDLDGRSYLDFFGGILTISVGHANDEVNQAVIAQMARLTHVSALYPTVPMVELAEILAHITPGKLQKCFFVTSGTEANETAVMMAQSYTHNQEILALRHGYSGRSLLAQALTGHARWRAVPSQVAGVKHAPARYCCRCPLKLTYPSCGVACAQQIEEIIETTTTGRIAGLLAEPIQGVGGFITPPQEYFEIAVQIVRKYGGVFIADEVQTGFGRTGKMWGIEHYNVEPDMMTVAKGIANGHPLGALIATVPVADSLRKPSISTFGGNPVSCVAAKTTIEIIQRDHLQERAKEMGDILNNGLQQLQHKYPRTIGDVRGMGLMQALELVVDETVQNRTPHPQATLRLLEETKKRGLLIGKGGLYGNVVRIAPPLTIQKDDIQEAIEILDESFACIEK